MHGCSVGTHRSVSCRWRGDGYVLEGVYLGQSRNTITDAKKEKHRHLILSVEVSRAFRRQFEGKGEAAVVQSDKGVKRTGYLQSSYQVRFLH